MKSLRLALCLIRIPRLFASLFLFPLILSLLVVYGQLFATGLFVRAFNKDATWVKAHQETTRKNSLVRQIIYGTGEVLPDPVICRWKETIIDGALYEVPPNQACSPDQLDVALRVADPENYDVSKYFFALKGNVHRIHICKTCSPHLVIHPESPEIRSNAKSIWALSILSLVRNQTDIQDQYVEVYGTWQEVKDSFGVVYLEQPGLQKQIKISGIYSSLAVIFSIAFLVIIALWLALKAHRKVLDYFSKSSALLPMVAASGRGAFYGSIWILTVLRVGAFLLAAVPITLHELNGFISVEDSAFLSENGYAWISVWAITLISSLSLATIVASIAELKHRKYLFSFVYKYIPLAVCLVGALAWSASFIFATETAGMLRSITSSLPILGLAPILISPIAAPRVEVMLIHTVLTILLISYLIRINARWFEAHLEEI